MATAREEAERLVAAALAAAQFASRTARRNYGPNQRSARDSGNDMFEDLAGLANMASKFLGASGAGFGTAPGQAPEKHHRIANGSDECCICPICRAIAAVRDPSPEFAERLASGASDLAAGVTSILRAFGEATRRAGRSTDNEHHAVVDAQTVAPAQRVAEHIDDAAVGGVPVTEPEPEPQPEPGESSAWPSWPEFGNVWQAATRAQDEPVRADDAAPAKKTVAKKAVAKKTVAKKTVAKKAVKPTATDQANLGTGAAEPSPGQSPAKKASAKAARSTPAKRTGKATAAKAATAKTTAAKKTAAKKTAAKKATPRASGPKKAQ
jgi:hypothetical protein